MIDRATVDKIMDAVNIVDVVSEFVHLRKAGVNYKGLCPFHDDKTPSFMVSPSKGICHCFACGKGGNAVNFIMEHEQVSYPEALRWLAKKYNIEIKERELTGEEKREASERESMFVVNEWAMQYFQQVINTHPDGKAIGLQYLRSRGFRDDIIEKFKLGFALADRSALSSTARRQGYQEEFLVKTGLCYRKESTSDLVDRYAGRVIFPWINVSGKVCAFGGRLLDSRTKGVQQKYVNSPESDIYHKDHELYGLYWAKKQIVKEDKVYMVEGYTDVISMHQCGIENVVANSGTALSIHQIRLLHRFTSNIVLLYDGDEAGIHAAMRGTDMLLSEGMNIKVLLFPDGDDPDSFAKKHSSEEFRRFIEEKQTDFIQFKTAMMLDGVSDPIKRSEAISSIVRSISVIPDHIIRDTYLHDCSHRLGIKEETLISSMNKFIRGDMEEKEKERERNQRRQERLEAEAAAMANGAQTSAAQAGALDSVGANAGADDAASGVSVNVASNANVINLNTVSERTKEVERLLVQAIIKYGDIVILKNVECEDKGHIDLTVAQYIDYDLAQDGLSFDLDVYNRILAEAVAQSGKQGFCAEQFFMSHHDHEVSSLAAQLAIQKYQLSKSLEMKPTVDSIRTNVMHLITDFRLAIVEQQLKDLQTQLRHAGNDIERVRALLIKHRDVQIIRDQLARQVGR